MADQNLTTRYQLEGDREFKAKLQRLGREGADAIKAIQQANSRLGQSFKRTQRALDTTRAKLQAVRRHARRFGDTMRSAGDGVGRFARSAGAGARNAGLLAAAAGGAATAVGAIAKQTAEYGTNVLEMSNRLGVSAEAMQELIYTGQQFGVQAEAMRDAFKEMEMRAHEWAQTGKGPAAEAINTLIEKTDLTKQQVTGNLDKPIQLFFRLKDAIAQVGSVAARQRLSDEIMGGQGGEQLVEMLSASNAQLARFAQEAHQAGTVMGGGTLQNSREFARAMNRFQAAVIGARNTVGAELMPGLTTWLKEAAAWTREHNDALRQAASQGWQALSQTVTDFIAVFRGQRGQVVQQWVLKVADGFAMVKNALAQGFQTAVKILGPVYQALDSVSRSLLGIKGSTLLVVAAIMQFVGVFGMIGGAVSTISNLAGAVRTLPGLFKAVGGAARSALGILMAAPWAAALAGLVAILGYLIYRYWPELKAAAKVAWTYIKAGARGAVRLVSRSFEGLKRLMTRIWRAVTKAAEATWRGIKRGAVTVVRALTAAWRGIKNAAVSVWDAIKAGFNGLVSWLDGMADAVINAVTYPFERAADIVKSVWDSVMGAIQDAISAVKEFLGLSEKAEAKEGGKGYAEGGPVRGPGTGTSDSIPARLSDGEYVIPAKAVRAYGRQFFDAIRALRLPNPGFARGGPVIAAPQPAPAPAPKFAEGGPVQGTNKTPVTLVLDGESHQVEAPDDTAERLVRAGRRAVGRKPMWAG